MMIRRYNRWAAMKAAGVESSSSLPWHKDSKALRFFVMCFLTGSFLFIELIVGVFFGSLALQADAFHMFSDLISLLAGFYAIQASKRAPTSSATFGGKRFEVLGALMNSTFLLSTCFTIIINAIERFAEMGSSSYSAGSLEDNIDMVIMVAAIGLGINVIGMAIFWQSGHGHSHAGGGHDHGGHGGRGGHAGHSHDANPADSQTPMSPSHKPTSCHGHAHNSVSPLPEEENPDVGSHGHAHQHSQHSRSHSHGPDPADDHGHAHTHSEHHEAHPHGHSHGDEGASHCESHGGHDSHEDLNIRGVFLHVLGDALGSVAVILSGCFIKFSTFPWRGVADPLMSIVMVLIISHSTVPLIRQCLSILLQHAPTKVSMDKLRKAILKCENVLGIHDFHVWQLTNDTAVATVHVVLRATVTSTEFMKVSDAIKILLHQAGVHATTVQPEFVSAQVDILMRGAEQCHEPVSIIDTDFY